MTYSSEVLADSPLAYYRLGDASGTTCTDSSGNARHMTYTASPTLAVAGALAGDADTAVTFNGTTQYASIASAAWMNGLTAITLECWYKGTDTSGSLIGRGANPANYRLGITGGNAFMEIFAVSSTLVQGTSNVADGNWHHIVGTWDGSTYKIFVDGVQENSAAKTGTLNTGANPLRIGQRNSDSFIAGTVDEPAVYGTNIGSTRIGVHFTAGRPPTIAGTFAATVPVVTSAFTGSYRDVGTFAATLPSPLTAAFAGTYSDPPTGTFAASLPVVTADFAGTYTAPATPTGDFAAVLPIVMADFAGDYHPHESGTFDAVLPFPTADFSGTYTPGLETGSFAAVLPSPLTASFAGTYTSLGETGTFDAVLPILSARFSGSYGGPYPTDTSNGFDGLDLICLAAVTIVRPVTEPPVSLGTRVDKAMAYPTPTMVDGRPT